MKLYMKKVKEMLMKLSQFMSILSRVRGLIMKTIRAVLKNTATAMYCEIFCDICMDFQFQKSIFWKKINKKK